VRPAEDYDEGTGGAGMVTEYVSHCCGDAILLSPVTDRCDQCGCVAKRGEDFAVLDGAKWCPDCLADYEEDPSSLEDLNEDDPRKDR
jgi:hypothetical protein